MSLRKLDENLQVAPGTPRTDLCCLGPHLKLDTYSLLLSHLLAPGTTYFVNNNLMDARSAGVLHTAAGVNTLFPTTNLGPEWHFPHSEPHCGTATQGYDIGSLP